MKVQTETSGNMAVGPDEHVVVLWVALLPVNGHGTPGLHVRAPLRGEDGAGACTVGATPRLCAAAGHATAIIFGRLPCGNVTSHVQRCASPRAWWWRPTWTTRSCWACCCGCWGRRRTARASVACCACWASSAPWTPTCTSPTRPISRRAALFPEDARIRMSDLLIKRLPGVLGALDPHMHKSTQANLKAHSVFNQAIYSL